MKKREFIKLSGAIAAGAMISPLITGCTTGESSNTTNTETKEFKAFELPALGFDFNALEPNIDAKTMEIHHDKHHAGYVKKLNAALATSNLAGLSLEAMMAKLTEEDTGVRNNGGGHYNHSLFWSVMSPNGAKAPSGNLSDAINSAFGSFDGFQKTFSLAAATVFGSGWAWLCKGTDNKLFVTTTPNQDNPLMTNLVEQAGTPLMGIDVWEHAYYLNYQNRRTDYIANFFNVIDWDVVGAKLS